MPEKTIRENVKTFALNRVLSYVDSDPETNVPKLLDWLERHDTSHTLESQIAAVRPVLEDRDNNWNRLIRSFWTEIDDGVRRKLLETVFINGSLIGLEREKKLAAEHGCNVPWAILMDPTSACNLHCTGCWAAEYGHRLNMSYETLDDIIRQGRELGVYVYIYSGGEPLVRKNDLIRLCEAHPDCAFLAFTNGTLIDEAFADEMLRVKNFTPAISIEGFEDATDDRRGHGTFDAVMRAMKILRERRLLFGVSCCYTSRNTEVIGSEAYIDALIGWGAKFAWFFTYMPVGKDAVPELMVTPEQREFMYHQLRAFRQTKPLFTLDFWNDGEYPRGCIAGGKHYLHINANGDIEPCAFVHYSDSSVYHKTLLEALKSPLFMAYHDNQPFNGNMLRPCPVLDNPDRIVEMVGKSGAHSTDMIAPEEASEYAAKCRTRAGEWQPVAERLWAQFPNNPANQGCTGSCAACAACVAQGEHTKP